MSRRIPERPPSSVTDLVDRWASALCRRNEDAWLECLDVHAQVFPGNAEPLYGRPAARALAERLFAIGTIDFTLPDHVFESAVYATEPLLVGTGWTTCSWTMTIRPPGGGVVRDSGNLLGTVAFDWADDVWRFQAVMWTSTWRTWYRSAADRPPDELTR